MNSERTNVVMAAVWMIVITLALFFLPLINGVIGGAVGGYKTGSPGRGLTAAVLPAVVVALGLWILIALLGAPVWGLAAGAAVGILVLLADVGLFIGAAIGGWLARSRHPSAA